MSNCIGGRVMRCDHRCRLSKEERFHLVNVSNWVPYSTIYGYDVLGDIHVNQGDYKGVRCFVSQRGHLCALLLLESIVEQFFDLSKVREGLVDEINWTGLSAHRIQGGTFLLRCRHVQEDGMNNGCCLLLGTRKNILVLGRSWDIFAWVFPTLSTLQEILKCQQGLSCD